MRGLALAIIGLMGFLCPTSVFAATTINFTGVSSRGAASLVRSGVDTVTYSLEDRSVDRVSGSVTIDFASVTPTVISGIRPFYFYTSDSPSFISFNFDGGRVQPITSGAAIGGVVTIAIEPDLRTVEIVISARNFQRATGAPLVETTRVIDRQLYLELTGTLADPFDAQRGFTLSRVDTATYDAINSDQTVVYDNGAVLGRSGFDIYSKGNITTVNGLTVGALPEPVAWAMLLIGFGMTGAALRHRGRKVAATVGSR
ncbi:hypothetical protein GGQ80_002799 [Sphingomonas jinjuensis]|uniref:PEP-CTERM protein-sorting domain-containing protein n=1 Tax=Sphingomonas jinjuensis TaxID=535907 RepID=A0A840F6I6_9SPHN|nr:PEPxxWA-CTERM sorting domain-containing protein [Sphingomonas jinjuensis]MBB4154883.1 hypothetical protein [Sphingomonas jinjuensis]